MNDDVLLIDPWMVKAEITVSNNIDDQYIINSIVVAQDMHLIPIFGYDQYQDLMTIATNDAISGSSYQPCFNLIQKVVLFATQYELIRESYTQVGVKGLTQQTDNQSVISDKNLYSLKLSDIRKKQGFYATQLRNYLFANKLNFTLMYPTTDTPNDFMTRKDELEDQCDWIYIPRPERINPFDIF